MRKAVKKGKLELRLYGMVPYQLTGMQGGIQYGHAKDQYGIDYGNTVLYNDWLHNWKTYIVLNGGTTNTNKKRLGTLNRHAVTLKSLGLKVAEFYEPDLGDQLLGVVFILDERVFNKDKYPDFNKWLSLNYSTVQIVEANNLKRKKDIYYRKWLKTIGGEKNQKIREFISKFRLA